MAPPAAGRPSPREHVHRAFLDEYVQRTGYPEEMLDPALDLEAELGIDTVKQVAVLAAVRERFGVAPDPSFKLRDVNTIAKAISWLTGRLEGQGLPATALARSLPTPAGGPSFATGAPPVPARALPSLRPAGASGSRPGLGLEAAREQVRRAVLDELVRRTGYPEEMLDSDLDLEAELGIDTVKQVAVIAAVRERFGLAPDPAFKLRDANTIRKAVEVLAQRLASGPPDPRDPSGGPHPPPGATLSQAESARTGPVPPRAGFRPDRPVASRRLLGALFSAVAGESVRGLEGLVLRISGEETPAREPFVDVAPLSQSPGGFKLRAVHGQDVAEAVVRTASHPAAAALAPVEILRAIAPERRQRAASGVELREALAPTLGSAEGLVEWARSDGFMVAVGGARLPAGDEGQLLAAVLACASEVASFAWLGLTGMPHTVCAIERAAFDALPAGGAEIGIHAKMVAPEGGLWRADATIVCGSTRIAEIRGLSGRPVVRAPGAEGPIGEAAARAWTRFCRRMQGGNATEDVA